MRMKGIARKWVVCGISSEGKTGQRGRGSEMERVSKDEKRVMQGVWDGFVV